MTVLIDGRITLDDLEASVFEHEIIERLYAEMKSRKLPGNKEDMNVDRNLEIFYERVFRNSTFEEIGEAVGISKTRASKIYHKVMYICCRIIGREELDEYSK